MDDDLRSIERLARAGEPNAIAALERQWLRAGLGWHGERVPPRMLVGAARGLYLWSPGVGHRVELTWLGRVGSNLVWISRQPVSVSLLKTFCRAAGLPPFGAHAVAYSVARRYARWADMSLPRRAELVAAGHDDEGSWCVELADERSAHRPFRVVVRARAADQESSGER